MGILSGVVCKVKEGRAAHTARVAVARAFDTGNVAGR
jgi:hypothetical protein